MAFPAAPANNQTYTSTSGERYIFITDRWKKISIASDTNDIDLVTVDSATYTIGEQDQARSNIGATERGPHVITLITVSGTHNYHADTKYAVVYCQGAGGSGPSANATSSTNVNGGSGGAGGSCAVGLVEVEAYGITSASVTIGAGATGTTSFSTNSGDDGTAGGWTNYTDSQYDYSGFGGDGGFAGASWASGGGRKARPGKEFGFGGQGKGLGWLHVGGPSGTSSGGGDNHTTTSIIRVNGGAGGHSYFGAGAKGQTSGGSTGAVKDGFDATIGYGGGGGSGLGHHGGGGAEGGNGAAGCVLIVEYR